MKITRCVERSKPYYPFLSMRMVFCSLDETLLFPLDYFVSIVKDTANRNIVFLDIFAQATVLSN